MSAARPPVTALGFAGLAASFGPVATKPLKVSKPITRRTWLSGSRMALSVAHVMSPPPPNTPHSTTEPGTVSTRSKIRLLARNRPSSATGTNLGNARSLSTFEPALFA